jgi:hypothetical protein
MGVGAYISGFEVRGYQSIAFGTPIVEKIQAHDGQRLAFLSGAVTCAGTAQILSFMYAQGTGSRNTTSAGAVSGQAHLLCSVAPKDPAGNAAANLDIIAYQLLDGTWEFNVVSSLNVLDITLTSNITGVDAGGGAAAVAAGAKVMIFGIVADGASQKLNCLASVQNKFGGAAGASGIVLAHPYIGEPYYVYNPNATATTSLDNLLFGHINK